MKKLFYFLLILISTHAAYSQAHSVFHIGHSLVNLKMPAMLKSIANSINGTNHSYKYHVGNGASMNFLYTNPNSPGGQGAKFFAELPSGKFDVLVVTEAVPLKGHLLYSGTYDYADSFYQLILKGNKNAKLYIYETWHCTNSGNSNSDTCDWDADSRIPWRMRLRNDLVLWESIADSVKKKHPTNDVLLVPAGQCWAALYDSIQAGKVPGITNYKQLFSDTYHPNELGNYFVALVHFATIYGRSPVGATNQTISEDGVPFDQIPSPALAKKMQEIVWEVVSHYPKSGVKSTKSVDNAALKQGKLLLSNGD